MRGAGKKYWGPTMWRGPELLSLTQWSTGGSFPSFSHSLLSFVLPLEVEKHWVCPHPPTQLGGAKGSPGKEGRSNEWVGRQPAILALFSITVSVHPLTCLLI